VRTVESLIARAARHLVESNYVIALTGAGMSTESGIPDFRGPQGVWTKNPDAERRAYLGWPKFLEDPRAWWEERLTASTSALGELGVREPNAGHYALVELEKMGIVKCLVTQNVDGLHEKAGQQNLYEYHGSFAKLRCIECNARFRRDEFDLPGLLQKGQLPPTCPSCGGVIKTDGVGFGEPIPSDVAQGSLEESWKCDMMLICGTSAVVYPFANLPRVARQRGVATIVEVNAEPTPLTHEGISDFIIQGKTGEVLPAIVEEVKRLRR
jgi:NAD-dependent deacetylase